MELSGSLMATKKRWSQRVTQTSDAMTLEEGVFKRKPAEIAKSVKRSAERSHRRKSTPFRSAMSMLTFYENRAGKGLSVTERSHIERAKDELRKLYGKTATKRRKVSKTTSTVKRRKTTAKRATRKRRSDG
jgi:hypothetical protein